MTVSLVYLPLHPSGCPSDVGAVSLPRRASPLTSRSNPCPGIAWTEVQAAGFAGSEFTGPAFPQTPEKEYPIDLCFPEASGVGADLP